MSETPHTQTILRVADLPQRKPHHFALTLDAEACAQIARDLDLTALRKLRFEGSLRSVGKHDWLLEAELGATAVQPCVVTLEPVMTRIDAPVRRLFLRDYDEPVESEEVEMPEDDTTEALGPEINLMAILGEALALHLPDYPRTPEATLEQSAFAADGVTPMSDEDTKPFAGLAALKDKLENPDKS